MAVVFKKAERKNLKSRVAILGPAGSGKTYTGLKLARALVGPRGRVGVIDTENGTASKYVGLEGIGEFDVVELTNFSPDAYVEAIHAAESAGFDVILTDSLTHAWSGKGGALEQVDQAAKKAQGNSYVGWRDVTPKHNAMVEALVRCTKHLIVTMRVKMAYELQKDERTGKTAPVKIGLQPIQRDGLEYEFDVVCDMTVDHFFSIGKTRCSALDGFSKERPSGEDIARPLLEWLNDTTTATPMTAPTTSPAPAASPAAASPAPAPASPHLDVVAGLNAAETSEALELATAAAKGLWPKLGKEARIEVAKAVEAAKARVEQLVSRAAAEAMHAQAEAEEQARAEAALAALEGDPNRVNPTPEVRDARAADPAPAQAEPKRRASRKKPEQPALPVDAPTSQIVDVGAAAAAADARAKLEGDLQRLQDAEERADPERSDADDSAEERTDELHEYSAAGTQIRNPFDDAEGAM